MSDGETDGCFLRRNLPPDIIVHVLSRLPLKSLCRFKSVSHSWNSIISSPYFAQTHIVPTNTNNPQKIIIVSRSSALYSVDFADVNPTAKKLDFPLFELSAKRVKILGSCNGLLLVSYESKSIFLWNPFTRECKKLPEFPFFSSNLVCVFKCWGHGIGYDSSTDDYKVVILTFYSHNPNVAVYSLKTDTWRIIPPKTDAWTRRRIQDSYFNVHPSPGLHFSERLHWLWKPVPLDDSCVILTFDFADEIFREVQLPASFDNYMIEYHHQIAVAGGCLCFLVWLSRDHTEVWMMKEYGIRESWTRLMVYKPGMSIRVLLCFLSEDDFVLATGAPCPFDGDKLVVYNTKKKTLMDVVIRDVPSAYTVEATYVETLVSPNHRGRIERQCEVSSVEG